MYDVRWLGQDRTHRWHTDDWFRGRGDVGTKERGGCETRATNRVERVIENAMRVPRRRSLSASLHESKCKRHECS